MKKLQATCAIIKNNKGEILLIKRGQEPFAGCWALISGIGESKKELPAEEAVSGEVEWDIQTKLLEPKELFVFPVKNDEKVESIVVFEGKVKESEIKIRPPYTTDYKWALPGELEKLTPLAFKHEEILSRYMNTRQER